MVSSVINVVVISFGTIDTFVHCCVGLMGAVVGLMWGATKGTCLGSGSTPGLCVSEKIALGAALDMDPVLNGTVPCSNAYFPAVIQNHLPNIRGYFADNAAKILVNV